MNLIDTIDVPQANSLRRVCDLIALVDEGIEDKKALASQLGLVARELDYYKHAARILGFAHFDPPEFYLSETGRMYLRGLTPDDKRSVLANAVRGAHVFRELLANFPEVGLEKNTVATFLIERTSLNRTTARRRADTMLAWLRCTV
jgi:hypothetical protein